MINTEERVYYVYIYKKPNGTPFYVGKGKEKRAFFHLREALFSTKSSHKINTIRKIFKNEEIPIIEFYKENLSHEESCEIEMELIKKFGRADLKEGTLTNLTNGGEGSYGRKHKHSPKTIKLLKEKNSGKNNGMFGKLHSEETKEKIRKSKEDFVFTEEHKKKISSGLKGIKRSEEFIENLRIINTGKKMSEEARRKLSKSKTGTKLSEGTKKKISVAMKGENHPNYGKTGKLNWNSKPVKQIDKITGETINIWENAVIAAKALKKEGCNATAQWIGQCCKGRAKTSGGFKWEYV